MYSTEKIFAPRTRGKEISGRAVQKRNSFSMGWAPTQKLLQESIVQQLDALQALDQLAPLTAAKEHLPGDIINILECLRKADNIPFNQLYSLAEDCTDRYYMKVIQTLTCLMKNSFHDRQLVLVNTARVLKFLSKYHNLPDHFHSLKTTLQAEFELLKTTTSKNIQSINEAVESQQAYTTVLYGHINTLYTKLVHLDKQVQIHCIYPHPQSDVIQLNTPDYDPDIDEDPDPVTDVQPLNAKSGKEDTSRGTPKSEDHNTISSTTNRPKHQPSEVSPDINNNEHNNIEQHRAEHPSNYHPQLEDIPELETDEENWDESQFDDTELLYNHNSTEESDRIYHEYSAYFEKVEDQEYNPYHTAQGVKYHIPELDYYPTNKQAKQYQRQQNQNVYLPPPPLSKTYVHGMVEAEAQVEAQTVW